MDISGIREAIQAFYEAQQTAGTATGKSRVSFENYIKDAAQRKGTVFPEGEDVVMSHPPLYQTQYAVDMNKSKEEMTLDEYKQYICNTVSGLPISASRKVSASGTLIFKEEAFESMKNNPEYEKYVIDMLKEQYAAQVSPYVPNVSYQVIGDREEACYGSVIPIRNYGMMSMGFGSSMSGTDSSLMGLLGMGNSLFGTNASTLGLGSTALGLLGLGTWNTGGTGSISGYGTNYANMVNAYKKTTAGQSGNTSIREYKSRWRKAER